MPTFSPSWPTDGSGLEEALWKYPEWMNEPSGGESHFRWNVGMKRPEMKTSGTVTDVV